MKSNTRDKDQPKAVMPIDYEIRTLVNLLNQSPYIQTTSSCSGHPDQGEMAKASVGSAVAAGFISNRSGTRAGHSISLSIC